MSIQIHWACFNWVFIFYKAGGKSLVCILNITHLSYRHIFSNIFPILWLSFIFLMVSSVTKHFHFDETKSTCVFLSFLLLVSYLRRFCPTGGYKDLLLHFLLRSLQFQFLSLGLNCCCLVTKLCLTICDPVDCSLAVSSVHFLGRILEWVVISFSRGSS